MAGTDGSGAFAAPVSAAGGATGNFATESGRRSGPGEDAVRDASFETILGRLETVVARLEAGDLPLEDSLAVFEEGVRLAREGQKRLDTAERRVEELLASSEGTETRPIRTKEP